MRKLQSISKISSISTIKKALLAPLARDASKGSTGGPRSILVVAGSDQAASSAINTTSFVTRHDHHNIEIKNVTDLGSAPSVIETDIYLFAPRTFELQQVGARDLMRDFRSRIRLAVPVAGEKGAAALECAVDALASSISRIETAEATGLVVSDLAHPLCEEVLEATKDLCAVVSGTLKHATADHTRKFFLTQSVWTTEDAALSGLHELSGHLHSMRTLMRRVRETAQSKCEAPRVFFALLDEFLSQHYIQYLGALRNEIGRLEEPKMVDIMTYRSTRATIEQLLDVFQEEEANHRLRFGVNIELDNENELERERRLVRLSQLKKFFQSKSFVDVTRAQSAQKVSETMAIAGTAMAALMTAAVEHFSHARAVSNVAFQGLLVVAAGVMFYVLRDRMKDKMKTSFQLTAQKFLPDYEQQLMAHDRKIGTIKEWFRVRGAKDIPDDVRELRHSICSEMEKRLPEDIFHCRKIQEVEAGSLEFLGQNTTRSLHESTRLNFERYLKFMDDPFKDLTELDASGRFVQARSHRVYHFYICVKKVARTQETKWAGRLRAMGASLTPTFEQSQIYRVVLDKNGVVRVEDVAI